MKRNLKSYLFGFFNGFGCIFTFWETPKFKDNNIKNTPLKSVEEMNRESFNKSWYQVGSNLRQAYDNVANKYGYKNEQ